MNRWTPKTTLIVAGVAVVGLWYLKGRAVETAKTVGNAVNPIDEGNIFNRGWNALWGSVTDGQGTFGTDVYEFFHPEEDNWWENP